jgi:hypothetical protein
MQIPVFELLERRMTVVGIEEGGEQKPAASENILCIFSVELQYDVQEI